MAIRSMSFVRPTKNSMITSAKPMKPGALHHAERDRAAADLLGQRPEDVAAVERQEREQVHHAERERDQRQDQDRGSSCPVRTPCASRCSHRRRCRLLTLLGHEDLRDRADRGAGDVPHLLDGEPARTPRGPTSTRLASQVVAEAEAVALHLRVGVVERRPAHDQICWAVAIDGERHLGALVLADVPRRSVRPAGCSCRSADGLSTATTGVARSERRSRRACSSRSSRRPAAARSSPGRAALPASRIGNASAMFTAGPALITKIRFHPAGGSTRGGRAPAGSLPPGSCR